MVSYRIANVNVYLFTEISLIVGSRPDASDNLRFRPQITATLIPTPSFLRVIFIHPDAGPTQYPTKIRVEQRAQTVPVIRHYQAGPVNRFSWCERQASEGVGRHRYRFETLPPVNLQRFALSSPRFWSFHAKSFSRICNRRRCLQLSCRRGRRWGRMW